MSSKAADPNTRVILYDAGGHDREVEMNEIDLAKLGKDQLLWVDVRTGAPAVIPPEMQSALEAAGSTDRVEIFDHFYRFAIPLQDKSQTVVSFSAGQSWVLTASDQRPNLFDEFIEGDEGETLKGKMTPTAFVASLLIRNLDAFRKELGEVDVAVDKLDDTILRGREKRSPLNSLASLRRRLSRLRAVMIDQRGVIHALIAPDFLAHVQDTDRQFLVEVNRIFERIEDDIARARETVIGSFELYASRVAQDTNQLVKVLTIATVITGIVGAVAGVFGMNFSTPFAQTGLTGFVLVTSVMVAVSVVIVALAIWRRWV